MVRAAQQEILTDDFANVVTLYKLIRYLPLDIPHRGDTHTLFSENNVSFNALSMPAYYRNIAEIPDDYITYCFVKIIYGYHLKYQRLKCQYKQELYPFIISATALHGPKTG